MSEIRIFEPAAIVATLERSLTANDEHYGIADGVEAKRDRYLAQMAADDRRGLRDVLVANSGTIKRLQHLYTLCPNFSEAIGIVLRAALVSKSMRTELEMPPLLLLGPPGIGKSHFARKLSEALQTCFVEHSMASADDTLLTGHSLSWRAARLGIVARTLIEGQTASPLIFIDEIEKGGVHHAEIHDPLHALLEPESSRAFVDAFLEAPIRADKILWLAASNLEIDHLRRSLLDRFLILHINAPSQEQRRTIVRTLYEKALASRFRHLDGELALDVVDALAQATPRRMRMIIELAIGFAVADRRRSLAVSDIVAARRLAESPFETRGIGFFAPGL